MGKEIERYQALVLITILFEFILQYLYFSGASISVESEAAKQWQNFGAITSYSTSYILYYSWLLFHLVGLIGMFFFWWPSKFLILISIAVSVFLSATNGISLMSPFENTLYSIASISYIFSVGMAFFSPPVLVKFRQNRGILIEENS